MTLSPQRLARASAEHPKRVIWTWAAILVASIAVVALLLADVLSPAQTFTGTPESQRAADQIERITGEPTSTVEQIVLTTTTGTFRDGAPAAAADTLTTKLTALGPDVVTSATSPSSAPELISQDGRTAVIPVAMAGDVNEANENIDDVMAVVDAADGTDGITVQATGFSSIGFGTNEVAENDLKTGEGIGIAVALVILLLVFGALVAATLPLILAIIAIVVALALTALIGQFGDLSFFVQNMITMMGLAVGIDYALFIVSRYREERANGVPKLDAIELAGATSSRAVFFSGMTVVVALVGLLIVPMSVFISLAVGAILAVLSAVAAALTLLPALLSVFGDRIEKLRIIPRRFRRESDEAGFWARVVEAVMRRPAISAIVAAGLLIAASIPYFSINTGAAGVSTLPPDLPARQAYETLEREFSVGGIAPAQIPILGDPASADNAAAIAGISSSVAGDPVLGTPRLEPGSSASGGVLTVPVNADATSAAAESAVNRLRAVTDLPVGGRPAENVDYYDISDRYLPIVVAIVLALSFLILLVAFRSIVVPLVAIVLNLLSVGAAFGLVTLVSQEGFGADLLGFQQVDTVEAWIPIFLFAVLFGLSMDYHVFLLSRIRERFGRTNDNIASITYGISSSGRLITGAALIMVAVFGGFALGDLVMFQQMGFGLGVAVLIDATIVRGVLLPAIMRMLGKANWYLPKALNWLPRFDIEGPEKAAA
jgi:RND superfamily putative drug exporter